MADGNFGAAIRARAIDLGFHDGRGRVSPTKLADYLTKRWKTEVKVRTVESWIANDTTPRIGRLMRLLEALSIHGDERDRVLNLAADLDPDDAPFDDLDTLDAIA